MANQYINKIVFGGEALIDLTTDTATAAKVLKGYTFHGSDGAPSTGTCEYDADTSGVTASVSEVLSGKSFVKNGVSLEGEMPYVGSQTGSVSTKAGQVTISQGYHDGNGKIGIDSVEQAKIIAGNIKSGVSILGVTGSYTGSENIRVTQAAVTPKTTSQTVLPTDFGSFDYISQVNVAAIPYVETDNPAGGKTVTIGATA